MLAKSTRDNSTHRFRLFCNYLPAYQTRRDSASFNLAHSPSAVLLQAGDRLSVRGTTIDDGGIPKPFVSAATVTRVDVNALGGNDVVLLNSVKIRASVDGGDGNDSLFGGQSNDTLHGGAGDDRITGNGGNDDLSGDIGDDRLNGNVGDDSIDGNAGNDSMFGGVGDDSMFGGIGDDHGSGDSGDDTVFGDDGNDTLSGGFGDDHLMDEAGDDHLNGNGGTDDVDGGLGDDDVKNDDSGGTEASHGVEGTITAIDLVARTVTIQPQVGAGVVVLVADSTIIQRNDVHTTLEAFVVGDPCEAKFDSQGNTLKIEAGVEDNQQDRVQGTITAIDVANSKVTIKKQDGDTVVISVAPTTKIERNGQEATLAEYKLGDACEVRFDSDGLTPLKIEAIGT